MIVRFTEVTDRLMYGKFIVARLDPQELETPSAMPEAQGAPLLSFAGQRRFNRHTTLVWDLQRGTGAAWTLKALDMDAYHREKLAGLDQLVCPMYFPFVSWLHKQGRWAEGAGNILDIPAYLELPLFPENLA